MPYRRVEHAALAIVVNPGGRIGWPVVVLVVHSAGFVYQRGRPEPMPAHPLLRRRNAVRALVPLFDFDFPAISYSDDARAYREARATSADIDLFNSPEHQHPLP